MRVEVEAAGDGWEFELDMHFSNGHHRTLIGDLNTEFVSGDRRSSSGSSWILTLYHSWGTSTISSRSSLSSNTGGSIVALADGSFGTYVFTRSINAAGQGTSPWSGEQSKRIEASGEYIDTGADDELISDSFTTLSIDDDWTNEETEHNETTRYGGVDQEPYSFTTQDTYETDYETQRQTAEDTLGPHIAANQVGAALATGLGVVQQHTNYNGNGFGNAGTGSSSVQPDTGSGSGSGYSGPETGTLPNGNTYEKYDDGHYWYYKEWNDGVLVIDESGYHETFSINTALTAAQGAGSAAGEATPEPPKVVQRDHAGDLDSEEFFRSGQYADGTYWVYFDDGKSWTYYRLDSDGNILEEKQGTRVFDIGFGFVGYQTNNGWRKRRGEYDDLAKNTHQNHNKKVNNHVNSMRGTPTYDTTHGNFENGVASAGVGYGSADGSGSTYVPPSLESTPSFADYLPGSFFVMVPAEQVAPVIDGAIDVMIGWFGGQAGPARTPGKIGGMGRLRCICIF
jgi:hypothetical protein